VALNIKNPEVERLAAEVSKLAGESKTQAIRVALEERKERLELMRQGGRAERLRSFLEEELWPSLPADLRGKGISQKEQDEILGYGPEEF
jgi:antitoxin VapB